MCLSGPRSLIVAPNPGEINGHQRGGQGDWAGGSNASGRGRGRKRLRRLVAMAGIAWSVWRVCGEAERTPGNRVRGSHSPRRRLLDNLSPLLPRVPGEQVTPGRSEAVRRGRLSSCYQRGKLAAGDHGVRPAGGTCRL